jgi:YhcH/YjgK/YiaL family protein
MIFDRLERLAQYKGLNDNLDRLIDYALAHEFESLAPGKNEIDGDSCWMNSNVAELTPANASFERHMAYIDLQIPIDEGEIITVRPVEDLNWPVSDAETRFTEGRAGTPLDLVPGTFAIFFPGDAHNCGIAKGDRAQVRKLVGKAHI